MKYLAATSLAAVVVLAACSHDAPTAPPEAAPAGVSASLGTGSGALDFNSELADVEARMMPGFTDVAAADRLRGHFTELRAHLAAGERVEAARVLELSRAVLAGGATNPADSYAINSTLDVIGRELGR